MLSVVLKQVLVCPADLGELEEREKTAELVCRQCHRRYRIRDGIPVMLSESGNPAEPAAADHSSTRTRRECRH